jgi:hypothetical protein
MNFRLQINLNLASKVLLLLAEYGSIASGFCIFAILLKNLSSAEFASWEWLQVWLGLCLLLPRNGLDLVATRSAYRHPTHLSEWMAILILIRFLLSLPAFCLYGAGAYFSGISEYQAAIYLGLTIPVSATTPDILARVQGRFSKVSFLLIFKNLILLILLLNNSAYHPVSIAKLYLISELILWLMWWLDAWQQGIRPIGRWITLLYRGGNAIFKRSLQQSFSRWLRVSSYSLDAILLGLFAPEIWAVIAPGRRLLLSTVIPFGNWLGSISHQMSTWPLEKIMQFDLKARFILTSSSVVLFLIAIIHTPVELLSCNSEILLLSLARFGAIAYGFWLGSLLTAQRQDQKAMIVPGISCINCLITMILAKTNLQADNLMIGMILLDWISIRLAGHYLLNTHRTDVGRDSIARSNSIVIPLKVNRREVLKSAKSHA